MGSNGNNATLGAASSARWPDLYALLGVATDADEQLLRQRIRESYAEATANVDHRNMERRMHYQGMAERVLPQCRRILLNTEARAAYDEQSELHRQGSPLAMDFASFLNTALRSSAPPPPDFKDLTSLPAVAIEPNKSEARRKEEMEQARALMESMAGMPYPGEEQISPADHSSAPPASSSSKGKTRGRKGATSSAARQFGAAIPQNLSGNSTPVDDPLPAIRHSPDDAIAAPPASAATPPASSLGTSLRKASTQGDKAAEKTKSTRQTLPPQPQPAPPALSWDDLPTEIVPEDNNTSSAASPAVSETTTFDATTSEGTTAFLPDTPLANAAMPVANAGISATPSADSMPSVSAPATTPNEPAVPVTAPPSTQSSVPSGTNASGTPPLPGAMPIPPMPNSSGVSEAPAEEYRARVIYGPRVTLGEETRASRRERDRRDRRILSPTVTNLIVGIAAALLTVFILKWNEAPVTGAVPVRITYASQLTPVMTSVETAFEKRGGVDLQMSPMDAREGMQDVLGTRGGASPDVWIPSETLWSDRYNEVAPSKGRMAIKSARSWALSPMVLIARAERSQVLKSRFPNRIIPSWEALRSAVQAGAPGHFGLTNPQTSATGAFARLFMAREWADRNDVIWSRKAVEDPRLWQWIGTFEENVPDYGRLSGDMIRDLALGTADRYWWAIGYESDAIRWLQDGKALEIFYLPRTNQADHPLCFVDYKGMDGRVAKVRSALEQHLRSPETQKLLLQNGFRPTDIDISKESRNNPFRNPDFKRRGLRESGFRVDQRVNYRILNHLNVQWSQRF